MLPGWTLSSGSEHSPCLRRHADVDAAVVVAAAAAVVAAAGSGGRPEGHAAPVISTRDSRQHVSATCRKAVDIQGLVVLRHVSLPPCCLSGPQPKGNESRCSPATDTWVQARMAGGMAFAHHAVVRQAEEDQSVAPANPYTATRVSDKGVTQQAISPFAVISP